MESLIFIGEKKAVFWENIVVEKNHLKKKKPSSNARKLVDFRLLDPYQALHNKNRSDHGYEK